MAIVEEPETDAEEPEMDVVLVVVFVMSFQSLLPSLLMELTTL